MVKIKILSKGFPTTHYGFLVAGSIYEVDKVFADYCINRMKAAQLVLNPEAKKAEVRKSVKKGKK